MQKKEMKQLVVILIAVLVGALVAWGGSFHGQEIGGWRIFALAIAFAFIMQWILYIPAVLKGTEKFYDLSGGLGFVGVTLFVLLATPHLTGLGWVLGLMVILWAVRLATFLFVRVMKSGADDRFDDIKNHKIRFLLTWTLQGLWVAVVASAAWAGITSNSGEGFSWVTAVGIIIWLLGMGIEVTADFQKYAFKNDPSNKGKFIRTGIWAHSRHPNYFGEITLWVGVFIAAAPALEGWQWVTILSPILTTLLLTKVSGIPLLEKKADARWGGQADYEEYKKNTPVLVPKLKK